MPRLLPRSPDNVPIVIDGALAVASRPWQVQPPQDALVVIAKSAFVIGDELVAVHLTRQDGEVGSNGPEIRHWETAPTR